MNRLKKNASGFGNAEAILVLIVIVAIAGVGWYVWKAKQNTTSNYNSAANTSNVTKPAAKPKTTTSTPPQTTNQNVIKFPELGIEITVPDSIKDLTYTIRKGTYDNDVAFIGADISTKSISALGSGCSSTATPAFGGLFRTEGQAPKAQTSDTGQPTAYKQFSTFYISQEGTHAQCSDSDSVMSTVSSLDKVYLDSLPTMQQL